MVKGHVKCTTASSFQRINALKKIKIYIFIQYAHGFKLPSTGTPLPAALWHGSTHQLGLSFIVVGGVYANGAVNKKIFRKDIISISYHVMV
jgi:hypothetical protein